MKKLIYFISFIGLLFAVEGEASEQVQVSEPWARPAQVGKNGAVFLKLTGADDKLIKVECEDCEAAELHTHLTEIKQDEKGKNIEVKKMRPIAAIDISKSKVTELKKGGLHIMLLKLKRELKVDDAVTVKLIFEKSEPVVVTAKVVKCCTGHCHKKDKNK